MKYYIVVEGSGKVTLIASLTDIIRLRRTSGIEIDEAGWMIPEKTERGMSFDIFDNDLRVGVYRFSDEGEFRKCAEVLNKVWDSWKQGLTQKLCEYNLKQPDTSM